HVDLDRRGPITADIVHDGDNDLDIDQEIDARSGDCVAGGQVFGVVGGNVDIRSSNISEDSECESGDVDVSNIIDSARSGPFVFHRPGGGGSEPPQPPEPAVADLRVTKTPPPAGIGNTFTITVTNDGPDPANATLSDPGATLTPGDPSFTCTGSTCTSTAPLGPGVTATFTATVPVQCTIIVPIAVPITNTATVAIQGGTDPNGTNNSSTASSTAISPICPFPPPGP
ncbi:MAG TPA: hypothetical protein VNE62_07610, partial [Actinomycetota bacterium]|nr:hypothetical protein [Actinomycetota bacterium]